MKIVIALVAIAGMALAAPSFAQDQKASPQTPQVDQGMQGMMGSNMMSRMNQMMDQCEKMMGDMSKRLGQKKD